MKSKSKLIFKIIVMGFALYGAIRGIIYFRSNDFVSSVAALMGAPAPSQTPKVMVPAPQTLSWCENESQPEFSLDGKVLNIEKLCDLQIESYDNSLLKTAKFNSKLIAEMPGQPPSLIEVDLNLGLFKYKDIIFSSQQLLKNLKNPPAQEP